MFERKKRNKRRSKQNIFLRVKGNIFSKGKPDTFLLTLVIFLVIFGLILVYDASVIGAAERYNDKFKFLKAQAMWILLGSIAGFLAYHFDYHNYPKIITPAIIVTVILLFLVLIVGTVTFGSRRWLDLGSFKLQPSELAKLTFTIYLASWLSKQRKRSGKLNDALREHLLSEFLQFVIVFMMICLPIIFEPDLGTTAVVAGTALIIYFISGTDAIHTIGSMILITIMSLVGAFAAIIAPYRLRRIQTFIETIKSGNVPDPFNSGYQINQVLIAIGSGGLFGVGFGESRQKFFYLVGDSAWTDTIFAVFAEEFGFLGDVLLVIAFLILLSRGIKIALNAKDRLGGLLAAGITTWIGLQIFLNIAANIALGPLTGIPLPFLSYGGSSMVVNLIAMGILLNISRSTTSQKYRRR